MTRPMSAPAPRPSSGVPWPHRGGLSLPSPPCSCQFPLAGVDSYRSVCFVREIYVEPWQTVSAPPGSNGFQAGALWSEGPQIAGEALRAGPERRRVLAGLREAERPRDAGNDEGSGDRHVHVASDAALRLAPVQGARHARFPSAIQLGDPLLESLVHTGHLLSEVVQRTTEWDGLALAGLPDRRDQRVEWVPGVLDRPEPVLVQQVADHLIHHGVTERLLAGEVMIEGALRHVRRVDDRLKAGRLETQAMDLAEAGLEESLPRSVGVARLHPVHTDQYEGSEAEVSTPGAGLYGSGLSPLMPPPPAPTGHRRGARTQPALEAPASSSRSSGFPTPPLTG